MYLASRIVLTVAGACIGLGGLYDVFTPRLPPNLATRCSGNQDGGIASRELLRALGGCLVGIGIAVATLANSSADDHNARTLLVILALVLPSEGTNAFSMYRVNSPYAIPLSFIALTVAGVVLGFIGQSAP